MISKLNLSFLVCPRCRNTFTVRKMRLFCSRCEKTYRLVAEKIPVLVQGEKGDDVKISKKQWDVLYKEHEKNVDYKKNEMIVSHTKFLKKFQNKIKKGIFLDLGCGIAWQSLILAKKNVKTIGIDISVEGLIQSLSLFNKEKVPGFFIQADFLNIPLKSESVNFVYWGLAIEYVQDTKKAVDEAFRVLKKDGVVVAPFPPFSLTTLIYHQLRGGDIPRVIFLKQIMEFIHVRLLKGKYMHYGYGQTFTLRDMKHYFKKAGFEKIQIGYFDTYYPLSLVPGFLRPLGQKLIKFRPFWPFAYITAVKK